MRPLEETALPSTPLVLVSRRVDRQEGPGAGLPLVATRGGARFPRSKNALAVAYAEGLNGPPNLALARGLWQQAAEQGNATAQYNLASLLVATARTAADMVVAADWLRRSAEQGDPDAQYFLGNLYYNGEGVPRQQQESIRLWRQAAAQGHVESEFSLAKAYLAGAAVPVDVAEAEKWMHKAARHGHPDAAKPAAMLARGPFRSPG